MSESKILLLGYCLRMFLISISGQSLGLCIAGTMLKRRKSVVPIISFMIFKFIVLVCILQTLFIDELQKYDWYELVCLIISICSAITVAFLFYLTFYGSAIKCITAMNISEILVSVVMLPAVMIVNILQKRDDVFLFTHPFRWSDFLIPVVMILLFLIFNRFTKNFLKKYRTYQLKHPAIWWTVYIVYVSSLQLMSLIDLRNDSDFMMTVYIVFLVSSGVGTVAFFLLYLNYLRGIRLERAYLNTQMGLLETHYQAIQSQVQQMENCQKMIAEQMEEITSGKEVLKEDAKEYLDNLKQEYNKFRAGMYCDDWRIDAVLYCQIETARTYGIDVECQIQGYDKNTVDRQTLSQLLFLLMHNGIKMFQQMEVDHDEKYSTQDRSEKKMKIRTGIVMGKFVISFSVSAGKAEQILEEKQIRKLVKGNGGLLTTEIEENQVTVVITLG